MFVLHGRSQGDNSETLRTTLPNLHYELFGDAVSEAFLLEIASEITKRKDGKDERAGEAVFLRRF
jgi:hypothetical protein